jgi:hypothetical protein
MNVKEMKALADAVIRSVGTVMKEREAKTNKRFDDIEDRLKNAPNFLSLEARLKVLEIQMETMRNGG